MSVGKILLQALVGNPNGNAGGNNDPAETREFVAFAESRMDRSHPFLRDFSPDDHDAIVRLKNRLGAVAGEEKAIELIARYYQNYVKEVPLNWESALDYKAIGEALAKEPAQSRLWKMGKFLEGKALGFLENSRHRDTCGEYREDCDRLYRDLEGQGLVAHHYTLAEKVGARVAERGVGYTLGAIWRRGVEKISGLGAGRGIAGIDEKYFSGNLTLKELPGALPGFRVTAPILAGERVGTLIIGDPAEGARAGMRINVGGGVGETRLEKDFGGRLQYQGVVTMQSDRGVPLGTVVVGGYPHQLRFDANRLDGYVVIFPDHTLRIIDQRHFRLSDITGKNEDRAKFLTLTKGTGGAQDEFLAALAKTKATILTGISFDPTGGTGPNQFQKWSDTNGGSNRRLLFTFKDGKFGVFDTSNHSTNEMLAVLYRLQKQFGRLERVVMCDRGMWDEAAWYRDGDASKKMILGDVGQDPSNRIYFYTERK